MSENQAQIGKFSEHDAEAYPKYEALLERVAEVLMPILDRSAPDPVGASGAGRKIGIAKRLRDEPV